MLTDVTVLAIKHLPLTLRQVVQSPETVPFVQVDQHSGVLHQELRATYGVPEQQLSVFQLAQQVLVP